MPRSLILGRTTWCQVGLKKIYLGGFEGAYVPELKSIDVVHMMQDPIT